MTIINYPRVVDCYTSYCFLISTTNDFIPVRNDMSPSPYPTSRKTIHWIVLLGRVTRGEGIKPLLEIKDFGPPARGGHFVLFHSFLPPQPYGTQFHSVHTSPVQLVSLAPHVGGREK